jgi:hypothetical protein
MERKKAYERLGVVSEEESNALCGLLDNHESKGSIDVTVYNSWVT